MAGDPGAPGGQDLPKENNNEDEVEQEQEEEPPPPPPLPPRVEVPSPRVLGVGPDVARVEWDQAVMTEPQASAGDAAQAAVQAQAVYALRHALQVQELQLPPGAVPDADVERAGSRLGEEHWRTVHDSPCADAEVRGLRPGRYFAVRSRCVATAALPGEAPLEFPPASSVLQLFRTVPTPPGPMQPPALAQRARNALKLKWSLPEETGGEPIVRYLLQMQPPPAGWEEEPGNAEGFYEAYSGDERSFKITRLSPGVRYTFRIMAFNPLGPSPWSLCSAFSTQASVPSAPEPPQQVGCTASTVALRWVPPPDNGAPITGYTLEVDDGREGDFAAAYSGTGTATTVGGLQSGLHYRFRLQAENMEGRSHWSAPRLATTAATAPSVPGGLAVMGTNRTSVTLAWQAPQVTGGAPVTGYEVQLQAVTRVAKQVLGHDWVIIYDGPSTATTFSALQAGCSYMARVSARNQAGPSPYSIAVQFSTAPDVPAAPEVPHAVADATSLQLSWRAPDHDGGTPITSYRVEMRCSPDDAQSAAPSGFVAIYSGPEHCVHVTDLAPGTSYDFRVTAINGQGGSPPSPLGTATTLPSVPVAPAALAVTALSSTHLQLAWEEPAGQGAPVTGYTVNMAALPAQRPAANGGTQGLSATSSDAGSADVDGPDAASSAAAPAAESSQRLRYETVYTGTAHSCEVKGLKPATAYCLRVRAHNSVGGSMWGDAVTVTTAAAAPGPPASLSIEPASAEELRVAWCPPERDNGAVVTGYMVEAAPLARAGGGQQAGGPGGGKGAAGPAWSRAWQGPGTSCSVAGLQPGRKYAVRVRATSQQGLGAWCEPRDAATLPAAPGAPPRPTVGQRTATALKVRWGLPAEDHGATVTTFVLQLRPAGGGGDFREAYSGPELAARVAGLQPGTPYELRLAAGNSVGLGPWSDLEAASTALQPPPPPGRVAVEADEGPPATLRVCWAAAKEAGPAAAEAVGYEVEATPTAGGPHSSSTLAGPLRQQVGRSQSAALGPAAPGTTYSVRMRSVGAAGSGHSPWSEAVVVTVPGSVTTAPVAADGGTTDTAAGDDTGGAAGKRKSGKKLRPSARAQGHDAGSPTVAPAVPRRGPVVTQAAVAKIPKRRTRLWTTLFSGRVLRMAANIVIVALFIALVVVYFKNLEEERGRRGRKAQVRG